MITFLHNAGSCDMYTKLISLRHPCRHPRRRRRRRRPCSRQGRGNISSHFLRSFVLRLNYSVALDARNLNRVRPGKRSYARWSEAQRAKLNTDLNHISFPIASAAVFSPMSAAKFITKIALMFDTITLADVATTVVLGDACVEQTIHYYYSNNVTVEHYIN